MSGSGVIGIPLLCLVFIAAPAVFISFISKRRQAKKRRLSGIDMHLQNRLDTLNDQMDDLFKEQSIQTFQFALCECSQHNLSVTQQNILFHKRDWSFYVPVTSLVKCTQCQKYVCELCAIDNSNNSVYCVVCGNITK